MSQRSVEEVVRHCDDAPSRWCVYSHDGSKRLGGPYDTEEEANKRLGQIEFFKKQKGALEALAAREGMTLAEVLSTSDYEMLTDDTADKKLVPNEPAVTTDEGDYPEAGEPPEGAPGPRTCVCPECGTKLEKEVKSQTPCRELKCPKCGAQMQPEGEKAEVEAFRVQEWRYGAPDAILPDHLEALADLELGVYGGIMRIDEYPELSALVPTLSYEGRRWAATRRQIDQLDQVTFGLKKQNVGQLPEYINEAFRVREVNRLVGPAQFITEFAKTYEISDEWAVEWDLPGRLHKFSVWGDIGRGKAEVAETSDDLSYLQSKYGPGLPVSLIGAARGAQPSGLGLGNGPADTQPLDREAERASALPEGQVGALREGQMVIRDYWEQYGGQVHNYRAKVGSYPQWVISSVEFIGGDTYRVYYPNGDSEDMSGFTPVEMLFEARSQAVEQVRVRTPDGIGILDSLGPAISTVYFPDRREFQQYPNAAIGVIGAELREGVVSYHGHRIEVTEITTGIWAWEVLDPPVGIDPEYIRGALFGNEGKARLAATNAIDNFDILMSARRPVIEQPTEEINARQFHALYGEPGLVYVSDWLDWLIKEGFEPNAYAAPNVWAGLFELFAGSGTHKYQAARRPVTEHVHRCHGCGRTLRTQDGRAGGLNRPPPGWNWYVERGRFHHKYCDQCVDQGNTKGMPFQPYKYYTQPYGRYREQYYAPDPAEAATEYSMAKMTAMEWLEGNAQLVGDWARRQAIADAWGEHTYSKPSVLERSEWEDIWAGFVRDRTDLFEAKEMLAMVGASREAAWQALDHKGNPITTVLADSEEEAKSEVRRQLNKNPSRRAFLKSWEEGGEQVQVKAGSRPVRAQQDEMTWSVRNVYLANGRLLELKDGRRVTVTLSGRWQIRDPESGQLIDEWVSAIEMARWLNDWRAAIVLGGAVRPARAAGQESYQAGFVHDRADLFEAKEMLAMVGASREAAWQALDHKGNPITTVLADSEEEAKSEVRRQLNKNPSRRAYLPSWEKGGEQVVIKAGRRPVRESSVDFGPIMMWMFANVHNYPDLQEFIDASLVHTGLKDLLDGVDLAWLNEHAKSIRRGAGVQEARSPFELTPGGEIASARSFRAQAGDQTLRQIIDWMKANAQSYPRIGKLVDRAIAEYGAEAYIDDSDRMWLEEQAHALLLSMDLLSPGMTSRRQGRESETPEVKYKDKILFLDRWGRNQWLPGTVIQEIHGMDQIHFRSDVDGQDHFVKPSEHGVTWKLLGRQPTLLADRREAAPAFGQKGYIALEIEDNTDPHMSSAPARLRYRRWRAGTPRSQPDHDERTYWMTHDAARIQAKKIKRMMAPNGWDVEIMKNGVVIGSQRPVRATWHVHEKRGGYGGDEFAVWYEQKGYPFDRREFLPGDEASALAYIETLKRQGHVMASRDSTPTDYQGLLEQKEFWAFGEGREARRARESQLSFNPVDFTFRWTPDWYEWDYSTAHQQARQARDAKARELRAQGHKVRSWAMANQLVSRGGIGSGKPHIDLVVTVYMIDYIDNEAKRAREQLPPFGTRPISRNEYLSQYADYSPDREVAFRNWLWHRKGDSGNTARDLSEWTALSGEFANEMQFGMGQASRRPARAVNIPLGHSLASIIRGTTYAQNYVDPSHRADWLEWLRRRGVDPNATEMGMDWDSLYVEWGGQSAYHPQDWGQASRRPAREQAGQVSLQAAQNVQRGQDVFVNLPGQWGHYKARVTGHLLPAKESKGHRLGYVVVEMASGGVKAVRPELVFVRESQWEDYRGVRIDAESYRGDYRAVVHLPLAQFVDPLSFDVYDPRDAYATPEEAIAAGRMVVDQKLGYGHASRQPAREARYTVRSESHTLYIEAPDDQTAIEIAKLYDRGQSSQHLGTIAGANFEREYEGWPPKIVARQWPANIQAAAQPALVMAAVAPGVTEWDGVKIGDTVSYHDGLRSHRATVTGIGFQADRTPIYHIQYGRGKTTTAYKHQIIRGVVREQFGGNYYTAEDYYFSNWPSGSRAEYEEWVLWLKRKGIHSGMLQLDSEWETLWEEFMGYDPLESKRRARAAYTVGLSVGDPVFIIGGPGKGKTGVVIGDHVDTLVVEFPDGSRQSFSYRDLQLAESAQPAVEVGDEVYLRGDVLYGLTGTVTEVGSGSALVHVPNVGERGFPVSDLMRLSESFEDTPRHPSRTCRMGGSPVSLKAAALAFAQTAPDEWKAEHNGRSYYVYQAMSPQGTWGVEVFENGTMVGDASGLTSFAGAKGWAESKAVGIIAAQKVFPVPSRTGSNYR